MSNFTGTSSATSSAFSAIVLATRTILNKAAFLNIINPLVPLAVTSVTWDLDPQNFVTPLDAASMTLRVKYIKTVGIDDRRADFNTGDREICITVRCEAYGRGVEASDLIENVLSGLMTGYVDDELSAIGIAYQRSGPANYMAYRADNRVVNVAVCDVFFNGSSNDGTFISTAGTVATVNGGVTVPGSVK